MRNKVGRIDVAMPNGDHLKSTAIPLTDEDEKELRATLADADLNALYFPISDTVTAFLHKGLIHDSVILLTVEEVPDDPV